MFKKVIELSCVLPAYNEEKNIQEAVKKLNEVLPLIIDKYEIIIVDDGSKDNTYQIALNLAKQIKHIKVIHHQHNRGKADAISTGFEECNGEYIFYTDADVQYDFKELKRIIPLIKNADIVSAYRLNKALSNFRRLASDIYDLIARLFLGIKVKDLECAFKIFKRDVFKKIKIESKNFMVETEILAKATKLGFCIKQIPITHLPRKAGKTGVRPLIDTLRAIKGLVFLKKRLF